jgi:hypothetical protein
MIMELMKREDPISNKAHLRFWPMQSSLLVFDSLVILKKRHGYIYREIELKNLQFLIVSKRDHLWG